jgi:dipeptidyl aminopeptidase/acylaminoacyl peptidase
MYSVPVSGGPSTKISPPLGAGGNVGAPVGFSADDSRVVFHADAEVDSSFELYSAPVTGGTVVKLNAPLPVGGRVWDAEMSPDGSTVIYRAEQEVDNVIELYAVPVVGGTPVRLSGQSDPPGAVAEFASSPDGTRLVYRRGSDALYSVPVGGGVPARLAGQPETGSIEEFEITPDSTRVVYRAREGGPPGGQIELFSVPIDGGAPVRLNATLIAGQSVTSFAVTPDSTRVVYRAWHSDNWHLWLVPIAGGVPVRVSAPLLPVGCNQGQIVKYLVARNGDEVVYAADQDTCNEERLYAVPLGPNGDGDRVVDLCDCAPEDGGVFDVPSVVSGLHVGDALATLSWTSNAAEEAGDGTVYDVLRGFTDELPVGTRHSDETCAQPGVAGLSWIDGEIPAEHRAYYYLVRPRNSCGDGSYGQESSGTPRDSGVCP